MKALHIAFALLLALSLASPAQAQSIDAATTNSSVTITTGGTFQTVLAAVIPPALRRSLTVQNNNGNATCEAANNCDYCSVYVGSGVATAANSIQLGAGQAYTRYFPYVPSDAIKATCTNTSDTLYVDVQ